MQIKQKVSEEDLQVCIKAYRENKLPDKQILKVFHRFAESIFEHCNKKWNLPEVISKEAAELCLDKLSRYDEIRGKASNFFATIILCYFRQMKKRLL